MIKAGTTTRPNGITGEITLVPYFGLTRRLMRVLGVDQGFKRNDHHLMGVGDGVNFGLEL